MTRRADLKQDSLLRILDAASRRLRGEGLEGAAIAPVMKDAGLTHGAFYSHFANKEELAEAAFRHALVDGRPRWMRHAGHGSWADRVMGLARYYLGPKHRDRLAESCPFSAIGAQAARAPEAFRQAYEQELRKSLNAIGGAPTDADAEHDRYDEAIALMAVCVGGLTLSRAVADPAFSDRILKVAQDAAATLAERAEQAA